MRKYILPLLATILLGCFTISYGLFTEEGGTSLATWTEEDAGQTTAGRQFLTPVIFSSSVYLPSTSNQISGAGSGSGLDADLLDGVHLSDINTSTASLQTQITALEVSTGAIQTELDASQLSIGTATGTLRTDITALGVSTGSLLTTIQSIQVSTGAIQSSLTASTGAMQIEIDNLEVSTGALQSAIDQLELDTATLSTSKLNANASFGGDISGTYDAISVNKAKGVDLDTASWVTDEYLIMKGTYVITGTPAGTGDVTAAGDNAFTGDNTHSGYEEFSGGISVIAQSTFTAQTTFSDFNTSDDSMWKIVYSTITGANVTSFEITGLSGNEFILEAVGKDVNSANSIWTIELNGDTTATNYNWRTCASYGSSNVTESGNNNSIGRSHQTFAMLKIHFLPKYGTSMGFVYQTSRNGYGEVYQGMGAWTNASDITSIKVLIPDTLVAGANIRIWGLK
jgi:hypothetical protein